MPLVPMKQVLDEAIKADYGVGAYNVNNMEQIQGIMRAAKETKSPVIIQASRGALKYTNMVYIKLDSSLGLSAETVAERLRTQSVLAGITGPRHFRLVCHYWIEDADIPKVASALRNALIDQ